MFEIDATTPNDSPRPLRSPSKMRLPRGLGLILAIATTAWLAATTTARAQETDYVLNVSAVRGDNRSRVARAARRFPVRQRQRRHGGDRDRAAVERAGTSKPQFWLAADCCAREPWLLPQRAGGP
jgi:hypothetical protein